MQWRANDQIKTCLILILPDIYFPFFKDWYTTISSFHIIVFEISLSLFKSKPYFKSKYLYWTFFCLITTTGYAYFCFVWKLLAEKVQVINFLFVQDIWGEENNIFNIISSCLPPFKKIFHLGSSTNHIFQAEILSFLK